MSQSLDDELRALNKLSRQQLKTRWRDLHRVAPPEAFTPDLLARGIAWRLQERALGVLSDNLRKMLGYDERGHIRTAGALRPGNRLVRRWRGATHVVDVTTDGFVYNDRRFGSLSEIARGITGTRWSGPRFFGLPR